MLFIRQTSVTLFFICVVGLSAAVACGYSFVGSCASAISLSINGTRDSFQLSPCEFEPPMDGLNLGSIYALHLSGANTTTWESCTNNVTAKKNAEGSITINFGAGPNAINNLPITPGWNYIVRMYQPKQEIINRSWSFPKAQPAK